MKYLVTFLTAAMMGGAAFAQIPNNGFETWTTVSGYDVPTGWDQLNAMTSSSSVYTCVKGTPGAVGSGCIMLTSKTVSGMGVMPGISCSGILDQSVMSNIVPKSGFPYTSRPASLTGNWQYMAFGADQGHISVLLSKWNISAGKRDTVSYTNYNLPGMVMVWNTFTIPLTYMSGATPDSAIILLSASGTTPVNNSYLYADDLAFTGSVTTAVTNIADGLAYLSLSPNPASGTTIISFNSAADKSIAVFVSDINGRNVLSLTPKVVAGDNKVPLNVSGLAKGVYSIRIIDGQHTQQVQKLIVE